MAKKQSKYIDTIKEDVIVIGIEDFLMTTEISDNMKSMFTDFYKKIGARWLTRDKWVDQLSKFKKLSPVETDRARKKGTLL